MDIQLIIDFLQDMDKTDENYYKLYLLLLDNVNLHNFDNDGSLVQS